MRCNGVEGNTYGEGLNVHDSWLGRQYVVRKAFSVFWRIGDLISHIRIFSMETFRFFPRIMWNGVVSAVNGE